MATNTVMQVPEAQIVQPDDGFTLRLARKPEQIIAEARMCAEALVAAVKRNGWVQVFGSGKQGREHLYFEAWSFLANMYRVTPRIKETRLVQIGDVTGYEAYAEAFHVPSGIVISTADSMCLDDEENWDMRPEYEWRGPSNAREKIKVGERPVPLFQLRSMAQTRAMSRALKGPFSWIVAMAGYAPTPAEDMGKRGEPSQSKQQSSAPQQKAAEQQNGQAGGSPVISDAQRKRMWAIGKGLNLETDKIGAILRAHGFERSEQVTRDKYDEIVAEIEAAG